MANVTPISPRDLDAYTSQDLLDILADIINEMRRRQRAGVAK